VRLLKNYCLVFFILITATLLRTVPSFDTVLLWFTDNRWVLYIAFALTCIGMVAFDELADEEK